jgi:hypothetical protein
MRDADRVHSADVLQSGRNGWLVIWSPWRRTFTGFACFTAVPVVIDEPTVDRFRARQYLIEQSVTKGVKA